MIPDENYYLAWQYCENPSDIQHAIDSKDKNWEGLESLHQIISITYDSNHGCYVVFWIAYKFWLEDDNNGGLKYESVQM